MGLPKPKEGEERQARAGATFDPKNFKGNAALFQYLNQVSLSMMKQKFEASEAVKKKKRKKLGIGEDYGTMLPDEEQHKLQKDESSSNSSLLDDDTKNMVNVQDLLQSPTGNKFGKKTAHFALDDKFDLQMPLSPTKAKSESKWRTVSLTIQKQLTEWEHLKEEELGENAHEARDKKAQLPSFLEILSLAIAKKQKSIAEREKMKKHRDHELKNLNRKAQKFNARTDVAQTMIETIIDEEQEASDLKKTIFDGRYGKALIDRVGPDSIETYNGFNGPK